MMVAVKRAESIRVWSNSQLERISDGNRLFWIVLAQTWRNWRAPLVLIQPDTVVRWHREWLRRRWTRRSARVRAGRPRTDVAIRTLVSQMVLRVPGLELRRDL